VFCVGRVGRGFRGLFGFWGSFCKGLGLKFVLGFEEFCGLAVCCSVF
jgi:hypothetical protein